MCLVAVPGVLRQYTGGAGSVPVEHVDGAPLADVLDTLGTGCPGLGRRILDERGELRRFVNVYIDGEDARRLAGLGTPVPAGAEVRIVPSIAGG